MPGRSEGQSPTTVAVKVIATSSRRPSARALFGPMCPRGLQAGRVQSGQAGLDAGRRSRERQIVVVGSGRGLGGQPDLHHQLLGLDALVHHLLGDVPGEHAPERAGEQFARRGGQRVIGVAVDVSGTAAKAWLPTVSRGEPSGG